MAVSLVSDAICSEAQAKRALRITNNLHDEEIKEIINIVTARIENIVDTGVEAADYREWYSGDHERTLITRHRPIIYVERVSYGITNAIEIQYTGSDIRALVQVYADGVRTVSTSASGSQTATSSTFASSPTMSTMATTLNALSGWTATAQGDDARSYDLHPVGGFNAKDSAIMLTYPDNDASAYRVDRDAGMLEFDRFSGWVGEEFTGVPRGWSNILIEYRAGYEDGSIPNDIMGVAVETVATLFAQQTKDRSSSSEGIGGHSVSNIDELQLDEILRQKLRHRAQIPVGGMSG